MSDYSYELPFSNDKLMKGIIVMLKKENKYDLANLLRGAKAIGRILLCFLWGNSIYKPLC